ncbi:MAG: alpha/beta hydrolase [Phycisphaerae bacterium]
MARNVLPLAAWLGALLVGCTPEQRARVLIDHGSTVGTFRLAMLGSVESLLDSGRIDAHERVRLDDGVRIDTWVLRARNLPEGAESRGTAVLLHGLWDSKARFFGLAQRLAGAGFDVILPDNRAHGNSSGQYITWGAKEKGDVKTVVDTMIQRHDLSAEVYVVGLSMGGCIAVQYAAHDPRVQGVLAIAPAAGAREVFRRMFPFSSDASLDEAIEKAGQMASFQPSRASAVQAASRLRCPLIVVHGRMDMTVPISHGRAIHRAAAGPKVIHEIPLAGHYTVIVGREAWFAGLVEQLQTRKGLAKAGA